MARRPICGKELIDAILTLPMVLPPTVLGYYVIPLVGRNGIVGRWLDAHFDVSPMFTWPGAVDAGFVYATNAAIAKDKRPRLLEAVDAQG